MALREQRRGAPVAPVALVRQIVAAEIVDRVARQKIALAVALMRSARTALVGRGIDQQLKRNGRRARVACEQTDHRRQVAAGAVATKPKNPHLLSARLRAPTTRRAAAA